jgi:hypothetical protein
MQDNVGSAEIENERDDDKRKRRPLGPAWMRSGDGGLAGMREGAASCPRASASRGGAKGRARSPDVPIGGRPEMQIASMLSEPYRLIASPHVSPLGFALVACPIEGRGSTLCPRVCSLSR